MSRKQTQVFNIRDIPKDWKMDDNFVYIGRGSPFGNPFKIGEVCDLCGQLHNDGGSTLDCFEDYLGGRMSEEDYVESLRGLQGKWLVCFCKPKLCHGDILKRVVDTL